MLSWVCTISVKFYFHDNLYWIVRLTGFWVLTINRLCLWILKINRFFTIIIKFRYAMTIFPIIVFQFILWNIYKQFHEIRFDISIWRLADIIYIFFCIFNTTYKVRSAADKYDWMIDVQILMTTKILYRFDLIDNTQEFFESVLSARSPMTNYTDELIFWPRYKLEPPLYW